MAAKKMKVGTRDFMDFEHVVSFGEKLKAYLEENARQILAIGLIMCLAVGAAAFWTISSRASAQAALSMLNKALSTMSAAAPTEAEQTAALAAARTELNSVVENYGTTEAGRIALFYRAQCKSRQEDHSGAVADYSAFIQLKGWAVDQLRPFALENLGFEHESMGDAAQALSCFEKAAQAGCADALIGAARMHEAAGKPKLACENYKKYLADQGETSWRELAELKVGEVCR